MKIAIIAAMRKELDLLLKHMPDHKETEIDGLTVYTGTIGGKDVVACQCGVGKVNSAIRTAKVIESFDPDLVINSGVAGGVDSSMKIGSILVADKVTYHDVWCPGNEYGAVDGMPVYYNADKHAHEAAMKLAAGSDLEIKSGLICSGDIFVSTPEQVAGIKSHFPDALGCDMESTSIAQTCYLYHTPFIIIRVMSDMPGGGENISEYTSFWDDAPVRTFGIVNQLIADL